MNATTEQLAALQKQQVRRPLTGMRGSCSWPACMPKASSILLNSPSDPPEGALELGKLHACGTPCMHARKQAAAHRPCSMQLAGPRAQHLHHGSRGPRKDKPQRPPHRSERPHPPQTSGAIGEEPASSCIHLALKPPSFLPGA
jgi:hypothetical protein